jgi:hypothetical protein
VTAQRQRANVDPPGGTLALATLVPPLQNHPVDHELPGNTVLLRQRAGVQGRAQLDQAGN